MDKHPQRTWGLNTIWYIHWIVHPTRFCSKCKVCPLVTAITFTNTPPPPTPPLMVHWSTQWKTPVGSTNCVFIRSFTHLPKFVQENCTIYGRMIFVTQLINVMGRPNPWVNVKSLKHKTSQAIFHQAFLSFSVRLVVLYFMSCAHYDVERDHKACKCLNIFCFHSLDLQVRHTIFKNRTSL